MRFSSQISALLALIILSSCPSAILAQFTGCDYTVNYPSGAIGYVESPNYSNYYTPGTACRWAIQTVAGNTLFAQCYDMVLPSSTGCSSDRLLISTTGDKTLANAQRYCGSTTFSVSSVGNTLVIALQTVKTLPYGGRFRCQITSLAPKCDCGRRKTPRIVGGVTTQANEFPMAAALIDISSKSLVCGATIITDRHALTAAHCLANRKIANTALLVGDQNMKTGTDTSYAKLMLISTFTNHPSYNPTTNADDIALVRTTDQIVFNPGVGRACLPFIYGSANFDNVNLEALGWGTLDFGGPMATELQKVTLQVMPLATCRSKLKSVTSNPVADNQVCTYTPGKDSCQYDSGGPLLYTDTRGIVYSIGVINHGVTCASAYPSINARVTSYLNWIRTMTGFNFCEA